MIRRLGRFLGEVGNAIVGLLMCLAASVQVLWDEAWGNGGPK